MPAGEYELSFVAFKRFFIMSVFHYYAIDGFRFVLYKIHPPKFPFIVRFGQRL
jgi:hypothetical protein